MYVPRAYALESNKGPAIVAALVLLGGYVVGPAIGHLLFRLCCAVDDNLADLPDYDRVLLVEVHTTPQGART